MPVPRGFWESSDGRKILDAVAAGKLTRVQAAVRASERTKSKVTEKHVKDAVYRLQNPDYRASAVLRPRGGKAGVVTLAPSAQRIAQLTDIAAEIISEAVRLRIDTLESENQQLRDKIEQLKAEQGSLERRLTERLAQKGVLAVGGE